MRKQKPTKIEFEGKSATAVRAMYQTVHGMLPRIRFTILTERNEEVSFELPFEEATKFIEAGIAAHSAISPPLHVPRMHF